MATTDQYVPLVGADGRLQGAQLDQIKGLDAEILAAAKAYADGQTARDTGWRAIAFDANMQDALVATPAANEQPFIHIRRIGQQVYMRGFAKVSKTVGGNRIATMPLGFRASTVTNSTQWGFRGTMSRFGGSAVNPKGGINYAPTASAVYGIDMTADSAWFEGIGFYIQWPTEQAWPTVYPGIAV